MYTRPYNDTGHGIVIPESYGGTLLRENDRLVEKEEIPGSEAKDSSGKNPWEEDKKEDKDVHKSEETVETFSFLSKLPFGNFLSKLGLNSNFGLHKLGKEEILIIATAAFLFFSKDGDKECAIMLLLLLFLG
jgi:hypothetical protein